EAERLVGKALEREYNLADLLKRPGVTFDDVEEIDRIVTAASGAAEAASAEVSRETPIWEPARVRLAREGGVELATAVIEQVEISIKYAGYIDKQNDEVQRASRYEHLRLPEDFDYTQVTA